ncbi:MAG: aldehyde dehydrogenase family protein [Acidobacteriales bacterium]|nr:aldehyde dehydrogenase family protein [Terriglobales bacterium]
MATAFASRTAGAAAAELVAGAREAQRAWAGLPLQRRIRVIRELRDGIARNTASLLQAVGEARHSSAREVLTSEILPLADACKFAEKIAPKLLASNRPSQRLRPFWLAGVKLEIARDPLGLVLVVGPSNYPLFIPGVQVIQALMAGNAIVLKPGHGGSAAAAVLRELALAAGVPGELFQVTSEADSEVYDWLQAGVDKVVVTGSSSTGREILRMAAETLTPVTAELSGCDAAFVLASADIETAARALAFGLGLNASRTCMRPHRVLVHRSRSEESLRSLQRQVMNLQTTLDRQTAMLLQQLISGAEREGARVSCGYIDHSGETGAFVLTSVSPRSELWAADIFAPVLAVAEFESVADAVRMHAACPYALSASIFGSEGEALQLAGNLNVGSVVINDVIVPTADPRVPFGGRNESGFGTTRGAEGLLEFTRPKAICVRRSNYKHLEVPHAADGQMFRGLIQATHSRGWRQRTSGLVSALRAIVTRNRER